MSRTPPEKHEPLIVRLGVMTNQEYRHLSIAGRACVEDGTRKMLGKYGPEFFLRDRDRIRAELSICGILNDPFVWWSPSVQRGCVRRKKLNTSQEEL